VQEIAGVMCCCEVDMFWKLKTQVMEKIVEKERKLNFTTHVADPTINKIY